MKLLLLLSRIKLVRQWSAFWKLYKPKKKPKQIRSCYSFIGEVLTRAVSATFFFFARSLREKCNDNHDNCYVMVNISQHLNNFLKNSFQQTCVFESLEIRIFFFFKKKYNNTKRERLQSPLGGHFRLGKGKKKNVSAPTADVWLFPLEGGKKGRKKKWRPDLLFDFFFPASNNL